MTLGILDSIDGALRDFETSRDAMRWVPEEKREAAPPEPPAAVAVSLHVDIESFAGAVQEAAAVLWRFFDDIGTALLGLLPVMVAPAEAAGRGERGGKLAVDGREYQRRLHARRRRKR